MARAKKHDPDFELFSQIKEKSKAEGFREGYKKALQDMRMSMTTLSVDFDRGAGAAHEVIAPESIQRRARAPRANSDQSRVLAAITEQPGMRGVEIAEKLANEENPVHERTVRTALNRLKKRSAIEQKEGGWYPIPAH